MERDNFDFACSKIEEEDEIVLIAGGELGPLKECITEFLKNNPTHDIRLFFGANSRNQLNGVEELRNLSELSDDFHMVTALNSSHPEWDGEVGLITDVIKDHLKPGKVKKCFLYGTDVMVNETELTLKQLGVPEGKIDHQHFERNY